jgi:hypothetical protein
MAGNRRTTEMLSALHPVAPQALWIGAALDRAAAPRQDSIFHRRPTGGLQMGD